MTRGDDPLAVVSDELGSSDLPSSFFLLDFPSILRNGAIDVVTRERRLGRLGVELGSVAGKD